VRLAKFLAHAGVASRRKSEDLITSGRVTVDGQVVTDPARSVEDGMEVRMDGELLLPAEPEVWALNKPEGVISTADEPGPRPAVVDLVESEARLYPVGRLDVDSCGLIILTNDGELANRVTHPRYEVPKTYRVSVRRPIGERELRALAEGVELEDGPTLPAKTAARGQREFEITIREGRNRQVRRMVEAVGNEVTLLERTSIGGLALGDLGRGKARRLDPHEIASLWKDAGNG
jgi:23S rRNA pseudouridine2605 synthase